MLNLILLFCVGYIIGSVVQDHMNWKLSDKFFDWLVSHKKIDEITVRRIQAYWGDYNQ